MLVQKQLPNAGNCFFFYSQATSLDLHSISVGPHSPVSTTQYLEKQGRAAEFVLHSLVPGRIQLVVVPKLPPLT